jgi:hypothetical protein
MSSLPRFQVITILALATSPLIFVVFRVIHLRDLVRGVGNDILRAEDEYAGLCERVGRGMQLCGSHNMPYTDYAYVQLNWRHWGTSLVLLLLGLWIWWVVRMECGGGRSAFYRTNAALWFSQYAIY